MVSKDIAAKGPFVPVHIFKHVSQTLYDKTRGGVDVNAQMRAILCYSTDTLKWEQKVVTQILKSITVNAWVAWRQLQREDMVTSREHFKGLKQYRQALNRVESLADFIRELTVELLAYADNIDKEDDGISSQTQATASHRPLRKNELKRLTMRAMQRKRYRLVFFNSSDGISLRLNTQRHDHSGTEEEKYCALCGNNTKVKFRGHRTRNMCKQCHVHICVKTRKPFKCSCWDVQASVKKLRARQPQFVQDAGNSDSDAEDTDSTEEPRRTTRSSKRPRDSSLEQQHASKARATERPDISGNTIYAPKAPIMPNK